MTARAPLNRVGAGASPELTWSRHLSSQHLGDLAHDPADGPRVNRAVGHILSDLRGDNEQIVADERLDSVRVVILTNFGLDEYIFRALRAGASGFLLKDTEPADLLQALRVVMRGDSLLSPAVTRRLIGEFVARPPDAVAAAGMETLTKREREVVALVARPVQRPDRRRYDAQPLDRQDPRQPGDDQARRA